MKPVFLFTFANDTTQRLHLQEEWRQVEKALQAAEDAGQLLFNLTPSASLEDIWDKFNRFHDQVAIFHYGGHSDAEGLNLTNASLKGKSLATLMGQEKALKLAFLNGCSNEGQVEALFSTGVPAVIATTAPIHDRRAIDLSQQFYIALASGRSIKQAFDVAAEYVNNSEKDILIDYRMRGFEREEKANHFEWGLYVRDTSALDWKIPQQKTEEKPSSEGDIQVNNYGKVEKQIIIKDNSGDINL